MVFNFCTSHYESGCAYLFKRLYWQRRKTKGPFILMKILMLGWELPPHNSGGLGVACYQLCKSLSSSGADIEFILPYKAEHNIDFMKITAAHPADVDEVIKAGIAYDSYKFVYKNGKVEWKDINSFHALYEAAIDNVVKEADFDVIHAHDWLTFRAGLRARERSNKPLILHVHSVESDRAGGNMGNPLVHEIERTSLLLADRVVAVSNHTKKAIIRDYKIPADKISVVHNCIDRDAVEPLDADNAYKYLEEMKKNGYRVVVNIGRLTVQKGLPNLLQAAAQVVYREPKTLFLIVGSGELEYELMEQAAALGISKNVIFTGFQRGKAWRDAYAIGDLFVMPSISEPFGLTPLEAIGYGTPALISKQSGVSEVIKNCLKVDFWDIDEMANQITGVVRSDALKHELHDNSLQEYHSISWQTAADSLFNIYRSHLVQEAHA